MDISINNNLTMTIKEVGNALGISRGLAYDLARRGELPVPVIKIGIKRMVVSRQAVENLLAGHQDRGINE
jgi:excisionase family DNA binding protein